MSGISDNLEDFRELSKRHYKKLIEGLDEKYCWKCPMRTNRSESFCREVDSWVRLSGAFEMGIYDHLRDMGIPNKCLEVLVSKLLEKKLKSHTPKFQRLIFLKYEENMGQNIESGSFLLIKENPKILKKGDKVLLPKACPLATHWYSKIDFSSKMPLKIFKIEKVYHKTSVKYIKTNNGLEIPIEYVFGLILNIINDQNPVFSELHLNEF